MRSQTSRGVPEWSGGKELYIGSAISAIGTSFGVIGIVPGPPEGSRGSTGWGHLSPESRMRSQTSRGVPEWSGGKELYIGSAISAIGTSFGVIGIVPGPPEGSRGSTGWGHLSRGATWAVGGAPWPTWAKGTVGFRSNFKNFPTRTQDHVMHSNERRVLSTYPTQTDCGSDDTTERK